MVEQEIVSQPYMFVARMPWRSMARTFDSRVGGGGGGGGSAKESMGGTLVVRSRGCGEGLDLGPEKSGIGCWESFGKAGEEKIIDELDERGGGRRNMYGECKEFYLWSTWSGAV